MDKEAHERLELEKKIGFRDIEKTKCCATCLHAKMYLTTEFMKYLDPEDVNPTIFDTDIECKCTKHNIEYIVNTNLVVCNDYE